ncbi:MAG: cysteine desulfurase [Spirochaetaceae bacterium]|jgi:cysteine desulfurase/selenocysteine lyase|nr:cysteine desulfurase [Spirochaetaceae bacterium]
MITPNDYGLPDPKELEQWASPYFPEFQENKTNDAQAAYSPVVASYKDPPNTQAPYKGPSYKDASLGADRFDVNRIRQDFPLLNEKVSGGKPLVWLDNGATTQKPNAVIDRISYFYRHENSNVHRGAHELAARSTDAYEAARETTAKFLGAPSKDNIVFVRGTTEGINLAAFSFVKPLLSVGDEIILTHLEHHANIVPWQMIAQETGALLKVAPVDDTGQIILSKYAELFSRRTKFVSVTHVSNALGTITPVWEMVQIAHAHGVRILVDGAQSVAHTPINVSALDADFFVFSGHKIFGPTGIGALYGKTDALEEAQPYQGGGNMIKDVTFERTVYNDPPVKFEAGTGNIADAVGLGAALDYVSSIGIANISEYEHQLLNYATHELTRINGLRLIGTAAEKASVLSFVLDGAGVEQVGRHLASRGIAVRAGHHCAQPILCRFGLEATVRPTITFYNTAEEIDKLVCAVRELAL